MRTMATWSAVLVAAALVRGAAAAPVTFSGSGGQIVLTGPGQVTWQVQNNGGTGDGTPTGICADVPGLTVADAQFSDTQGDAYDSGLTVWIDGAIFVAPDAVDVTGQTLTAGPVTMSSLDVTVEYSAMQDSPTLRTRVLLHNPTGTMVSANFKLMTPYGSDATTVQLAEGTGGDQGRWRITADDATTPSDPVNTSVFGGPANPPGADFLPVFGPNPSSTAANCSTTAGFTLNEDIRIPPGSTIEWLFYSQLHATIGSAQTDVAAFDLTPEAGSPFIAGMTDASLVRTVNWAFFPEIDLLGGGPGAGTKWEIWNGAGTDTGGPGPSAECEWAPGLAIGEGILDPGSNPHLDKSDAVDDALVLFVNGAQLVGGLHGTVVGSSQYTSEPISVGGLDTTVQYTALPGSPTLRTLMSFTNPTGAPVTATIQTSTNFGSDNNTGFRATSSGDTAVTSADRWTVSSDDATTPSDPVNLVVVAGPGSPVAPPSAVSPTAINCSSADGLSTTFDLTIPAGATRALLFFHELYETNDEGIAAGPAYDSTPASSSALLAGLDGPTLANVVNWAFCGNEPAVCDDGNACTDDICGSTGGCDHPKIARAATFVSAGCRLSDLAGGVQGTSISDKLRAGLLAKLQAAQQAASQASGQTGKARKRLVAKALRNLRAFSAKLKTKRVKKAVDKATLDGFKSAAKDLVADLRQLAKS